MATLVRPVWCSCGIDGEHLEGYGTVCAVGRTLGAAPQPLVVAPRAAVVASAHRTTRTDRASYGVPTPLGRTSRFVLPY